MSSNVIDKRIVEMQFENGKFERDVYKTIDMLKELDKNLEFKNAAEGFKNITEAANNVSLQGISDSVDFIQKRFTTVGRWIMAKKNEIVNSIETSIKRVGNMFTIEPVISGWEEYNLKTKSTQTILNNVSKYGSTMADVSKGLDKLNEYADKTTYSFAGMVQTMEGASTADLNMDQLVDYATGMSNLAAFLGKSNTELQGVSFQINQALTSGVFRLEDWKSLERRGFNAKIFEDTIKDVARENGLDIDTLIATASESGTFRDSLTETGWLTKDIFLEAVNRFADPTTELGQKAFEAATKTKTFSEALDQVKESLGSGWTKTFELLIGNVEQAKEFWTPLTNSILEFTDSISDSRNRTLDLFRRLRGTNIILNTMLTIIENLKFYIRAVTGEWSKHFKAIKAKDLKKFFLQVQDFVQKVLDPTPKKLFVLQSVVGFIAESVKVLGTILEGLWTILKPVLQIVWDLVTALAVSGAQLLNFASYGMETTDWATTFLGVCQTISGVIEGIPGALQDLVNKVISGYEEIRAAVKDRTGFDISQPFIDAYNAVTDFVNNIKTEIISGELWIKIQNAVAPIGDFFKSLFPSDENGQNDITKGIADTISTVVEKFQELQSTLETMGIVGVLEHLGNDLKAPIETITNEFGKLLSGEGGSGGLTDLSTVFDNVANTIKKPFEKAWAEISPIFDGLNDKVQPMLEALQPVLDTIVSVLDTAKDYILPELDNLYQKFKPLLDAINDLATTAVEALTKTVDNIAQEGLTPQEIASAGLAFALMYLANQIGEVADKFTEVGKRLKESLEMLTKPATKLIDGFTESILENNKKLKAETFRNYAYGVLAIVGAIVALSYINMDNMGQSIIVVASAVAMLGAIVNAVSKMTTDLDAATIFMFALFVNQIGSAVLKIAIGMALVEWASEDVWRSAEAFIAIIAAMYILYRSIMKIAAIDKTKFVESAVITSFAVLAKAIGTFVIMLSGAVWILANALDNNVGAASAAIAVVETLFGELVGLIAAFNSLDVGKLNNLANTGSLTAIGAALIEIAIAIDILVVGIFALAQVKDVKALLAAAGIVGALIVMVGVFFKAFGEVSFNAESAVSMLIVADSLIAIAIALDIVLAGMIVLVHAVKDLKMDSILNAVMVLGASTIVLAALIGVVGLLAEIGPEIALGFITGALAMVGAAVAIDIMIAGMITLINATKNVNPEDISKCWQPILMMGVLMLIMSILSLIFMAGGIGGAAGIIASAGAIWIFAQAISALIPSIKALGAMDTGQLTQGMIAVAIIGVLIVVVVSVLASLAPMLVVVSVAAIGFSAAIFLIAAAFTVFSVGLIAFASAGTAAAPAVAAIAAAFGSGLINGIVDGIISFVKKLPTLVSELGGTFIKLLDEIQTIVINFLVWNVWSTVAGLIKVVNAFAMFAGPLLARLCEVLVDFCTQILKGLNNGLERNKHELAYYIGNIIAMLLEIILEALYVAVAKLAEWFNQITPVICEDIYNFGKDMGMNIINGVKTLANDFKNFMGWLIDHLIPSKDDIDAAISEIFDFVKDKFGIDLSSILNMATEGVTSLTNGIKNAAGGVKDAAWGLFSGIGDAARGALDINSPSKVMQDDIVGTGIIGGILSGFSLYGDTATTAMGTLATDMEESFKNSIGAIDLDAMFADSKNPTITPVVDMSNIDTSFNDISKMTEKVNFDFSAITSKMFNEKLSSEQQRVKNQSSLLEDIVKGFEDQSAADNALADAILNANQDTKIYLDKDILIGATFRDYDSKLGKLATLQRRQ